MSGTSDSVGISGMTSSAGGQGELFRQEFDPRQQLAEACRTRLNAIIGFSELIGREPLSHRGQNDLKQLLKAARDLVGIVNNELGQAASGVAELDQTGGSPRAEICDILYIEDDAASVILIERILELRDGVSLKHAGSGMRGIEMAKLYKPKLILLDLSLPDMHGADVLNVLQSTAETLAIPVVILSANIIDSHIERLLAAGARNYLTKPFDLEQLLTIVDEWVQPGRCG